MKKLLDSLHSKILKSKFAEEVTEAEIEALVKAKELTNDCWIPCSERLPEETFKDYLVCLKNGAIFMAQYSTKNEFRMVSTNAIQYFYKENPVIAWQPLPEPYQPKGENNV